MHVTAQAVQFGDDDRTLAPLGLVQRGGELPPTRQRASMIMLSTGWMSFCPGTGEIPCRAVSREREPRGHMRASGLSAADKSAVTAACQQLIDDFLKPRFLPAIQPTQFNYPVDTEYRAARPIHRRRVRAIDRRGRRHADQVPRSQRDCVNEGMQKG
jgi:hypothetical protein